MKVVRQNIDSEAQDSIFKANGEMIGPYQTSLVSQVSMHTSESAGKMEAPFRRGGERGEWGMSHPSTAFLPDAEKGVTRASLLHPVVGTGNLIGRKMS